MGILPGPFLGFLSGCLCWCARLQLSGNAVEIKWHLRVRLEKEKLEVARFVLKLYLGAVSEDIRKSAINTEKAQNLAPVWTFDHVKSSHEGLFLFLRPRSSRRMEAFPSSVCRTAAQCGLPGFFIQLSARACLVWR